MTIVWETAYRGRCDICEMTFDTRKETDRIVLAGHVTRWRDCPRGPAKNLEAQR